MLIGWSVCTIFEQYTWQRVTIPSDRQELYQFQTISRGDYTYGIDFPA